MKCCGLSSSSSSSSKTTSFNPAAPRTQQNTAELDPTPNMVKRETLLQIPGCTAHLMDEGEAIEIARGDFYILRITDQNLSIATIIKVGDDLQWPLTKDEPVVKIDAFQYLFTLPVKDGDPLSYGLTFNEKYASSKELNSLDLFLRAHSCFSCSSGNSTRKDKIDWEEFAPKIEDYNSALGKAIAGGTGHIVRGIFMLSNAYTNQVQKGGELVLTRAAEDRKTGATTKSKSDRNSRAKNKAALNENLKRVRKLSSMTEQMSKATLDGVGVATGSFMGPLVRSQVGQAFFTMMPGEVLLASLDAIDKILGAAEAAEKQALKATSGAATRAVSNKYGEDAGVATEDALATVGHVAGTVWNVFKIRKAINPSSASSSGARKSAAKIKR